MWWPGTELNRRRQPFQGCALPPELPGHVSPLCYRTPCELWATPDFGGIAGDRGLSSCWERVQQAPLITTKLHSLNACGRSSRQSHGRNARRSYELLSDRPSYQLYSPTELPWL